MEPIHTRCTGSCAIHAAVDDRSPSRCHAWLGRVIGMACRLCGTTLEVPRSLKLNDRIAVAAALQHARKPQLQGDSARLAAPVCNACFKATARAATKCVTADDIDAEGRPHDRIMKGTAKGENADRHRTEPETFTPSDELRTCVNTFNRATAGDVLAALQAVKQARGFRTRPQGIEEVGWDRHQ